MDALEAELLEVENFLKDVDQELNHDASEGAPKRARIVKRTGHLDEEDQEKVNKERGYKIEILACQRKTQKGFRRHICMECSYESPYLSSMADHVNVNHKKIPLECTECDYVTLAWKGLTLHRQKKHKLKAMKCPDCNFKGVVMWQMDKHMVEKHDGRDVTEFDTEYATLDGNPPTEDELKCKPRGSQMGHRNNGGDATKYYTIQHDPATLKRSYACTLCDQKNSRQFNMLVHLNVVHLKRELECTWCEFTTLNEYTLNDHSKKQHGRQKKECMLPDCKYDTIEENRLHEHLMKKHGAVYDPGDHSIKVVR